MEIGRYYLAPVSTTTAAINRFRVVVEQFETTGHTPEALLRLVEGLPRARPDRRGADGRGDPGLQLPVLALLRRRVPPADRATNWPPEASGESWLRDIWRQNRAWRLALTAGPPLTGGAGLGDTTHECCVTSTSATC